MMQYQKKLPISDAALNTTASVTQTHEKPNSGGTKM
ncbi:hypothetical protein MY11210_009297 [Beauveria gryllotalpidicola]